MLKIHGIGEIYLYYMYIVLVQLFVSCPGTTVCIMSSQLCEQYHYETHSIE